MAACTAVLHTNLTSLQPPLAAGGLNQAVPLPKVVPPPPVQLGIDIDFYSWPGADVAGIARAEVTYIRRLHANAIAVSFPFFMHGANSSTVYRTSATPSPAALATLARVAEAAGFSVSIRPLLDEHSLGISRVWWKPAHPAAWFASYRRFLLPYARMAQAAHISGLFTGAEFTQFRNSPHWRTLDQALRTVYQGTLFYSGATADVPSPATIRATGEQVTIDAYPSLPLSNGASQGSVTAAWKKFGRTVPAHAVISEVSIAAEPGAYRRPYQWQWPGERLVPAIQVRWFTAACRAVAADHLGGIYFWSLSFGQSLNASPTTSDPASFVAGPGARAISTGFHNLGRGAG